MEYNIVIVVYMEVNFRFLEDLGPEYSKYFYNEYSVMSTP